MRRSISDRGRVRPPHLPALQLMPNAAEAQFDLPNNRLPAVPVLDASSAGYGRRRCGYILNVAFNVMANPSAHHARYKTLEEIQFADGLHPGLLHGS